MLKTLRSAFKVQDMRKKILYTFLMLIIIRLGSNLIIPGIDRTKAAELFGGANLGFLALLTGGSLERMSILALSISPYISSSIIMQLMTVAIPKLEELQKDGEDGRKKIVEYTRYLTVALAILEATAITIGFGNQNLIVNYGFKSGVVVVAAMTAGSAFLMWIGERITERGVGNGISMVLLFNILASLPTDLLSLYERFMLNKTIAVQVVMAILIAAGILAMIVFVVILQDAERKIPVQNSAKTQGRRMVGGQSSGIPLKVNTAGVIPVIFASSLMSFPVIISNFFPVDTRSIGGRILSILHSGNWFRPADMLPTVGALLYVVLIVFFAYFYTSFTVNPLEIADNLKKQGSFIPGIRPGKPTSDYLAKILNHLVIIGAAGLVIVSLIPIIVSGLFNIGQLSFLGTSLIIIVGVILETLKSIESQLLVKNYRSFLS